MNKRLFIVVLFFAAISLDSLAAQKPSAITLPKDLISSTGSVSPATPRAEMVEGTTLPVVANEDEDPFAGLPEGDVDIRRTPEDEHVIEHIKSNYPEELPSLDEFLKEGGTQESYEQLKKQHEAAVKAYEIEEASLRKFYREQHGAVLGFEKNREANVARLEQEQCDWKERILSYYRFFGWSEASLAKMKAALGPSENRITSAQLKALSEIARDTVPGHVLAFGLAAPVVFVLAGSALVARYLHRKKAPLKARVTTDQAVTPPAERVLPKE